MKTFDKIKQSKLAEQFHALHHSEEMLVLPNSWDCVSAKVFQEKGFPAVATSSAAVAWSNGYMDGEHIPPILMIESIRRIAHSLNVPLTADIEGGYFRDDLEKFTQFIGDVIDAGAIGINLEDGYGHSEKLNDTSYQQEEIKAIKALGKEKGIDVFINARTDAMLLSEDLKTRIQICIEKAKAFKGAGADGIFIPFIQDINTVKELKENISLPLNVLASSVLDVSELKRLKVNRVSVGSRPMMAAINLLNTIAEELKDGTNWNSLYTEYPSYDEANNWFSQEETIKN